jgi:hypothetical protein
VPPAAPKRRVVHADLPLPAHPTHPVPRIVRQRPLAVNCETASTQPGASPLRAGGEFVVEAALGLCIPFRAGVSAMTHDRRRGSPVAVWGHLRIGGCPSLLDATGQCFSSAALTPGPEACMNSARLTDATRRGPRQRSCLTGYKVCLATFDHREGRRNVGGRVPLADRGRAASHPVGFRAVEKHEGSAEVRGMEDALGGKGGRFA